MTLATIFQRRLFLGVAALALLAMAGTATTLATTSSHAAPVTDPACAQQDALPDGTEPTGPDTDTADVQCGNGAKDATGADAAESATGADAPESATGADTDTLEQGDTTTPDVPGATAN